MTKQQLANYLGIFVQDNGLEEASKVLSRMLLGLAHEQNAEEVVFNDDGVGSVLIKIEPKSISELN